jgi:IclR family transcriptional regulator, acetate operon repressor
MEKRTVGVQSVERALSLLEHLAAQNEGLRLSDLAQAAGLTVSTTHRLLTTLEQRGFVHADAGSRRWHVGRSAFAVGAAFIRQRNFVAPALPYLRRLRDVTHETANLGIIEEGEVITLTQVESREITRAISPPGGRVPVLYSGMGKAILATWDNSAIEAFLGTHRFQRKTPHSVTDRTAVHREIALIRDRGYAIDDEEFVVGLRCVAAVVLSPQGEATCALSVSGLAARMTPSRVAEAGRAVTALAKEFSEWLGGRP